MLLKRLSEQLWRWNICAHRVRCRRASRAWVHVAEQTEPDFRFTMQFSIFSASLSHTSQTLFWGHGQIQRLMWGVSATGVTRRAVTACCGLTSSGSERLWTRTSSLKWRRSWKRATSVWWSVSDQISVTSECFCWASWTRFIVWSPVSSVFLSVSQVGTSSVVYPAALFGPQVASRGVPVAEFNTKVTPNTPRFRWVHEQDETSHSLHLNREN